MEYRAYESHGRAEAPVSCVGGLAKVIPGNSTYTFRCNNVSLIAKCLKLEKVIMPVNKALFRS